MLEECVCNKIEGGSPKEASVMAINDICIRPSKSGTDALAMEPTVHRAFDERF